MLNNPVGWFEIYVNDMERAKTFYETVLKVSLEEMPNPTSMQIKMLTFPSNMEKYGAPGALVKMEGICAGGGGTLIYFSSDDCALEQERIVAAGGQIHTPKMSIGEYGFITLAVDTEGNLFGLHSMQ
ncbi:TPA: VOC family protein [Vibrio cholerae]|nr:VOC family protein [Vibrio cholerae]